MRDRLDWMIHDDMHTAGHVYSQNAYAAARWRLM